MTRERKPRPEHFLTVWREKKGLSQRELARRVGYGNDQISRWEAGKRGISLAVLRELARALGVEPADLFRHPDRPSLDRLARNAPDEDVRRFAEMLMEMLKSRH